LIWPRDAGLIGSGGFRRWRNRLSGRASEAVEEAGVNGEPLSVPDRWSQRNEAADMLRRRERLDADLALATDALEQVEEQARIEREKVALIEDRLARRTALLDELSVLADQENEAQVLLRRAERKLDRRLHQRAAIDVQADRSRRGRMVKVVVDPTAWESYREFSRLRLFQVIGTSVWQLVAAEVELIRAGHAERTPSGRRRLLAGRSSSRSQSRSPSGSSSMRTSGRRSFCMFPEARSPSAGTSVSLSRQRRTTTAGEPRRPRPEPDLVVSAVRYRERTLAVLLGLSSKSTGAVAVSIKRRDTNSRGVAYADGKPHWEVRLRRPDGRQYGKTFATSDSAWVPRVLLTLETRMEHG
jgi:hypothetical protein